VEAQNYLGIYLSKDTATVVCLSPAAGKQEVLGCFSVSVKETDAPSIQALANLIAQGCSERKLSFSEVAVALDCAMFMQHNVHSEFDDPKQIAQTIRFDTEEALATDVTDVAIAFQITSSDQTGSALTVFTSQRKILSEVLLALQSNNINPVTIEPDVNCLSRFIFRNVTLPKGSHPFFCMLSARRGYFIIPAGSKQAAQKTSSVPSIGLRTFLLSPTQDRSKLLAREVPVTIALVETDEPINCLKVSDSTDSVNYQQLGEKLGIEASSVNLADSAGASPQVLKDCADPVGFAVAYGAALAHSEKLHSINFRSDFMPYQGKKARLQKALKFAGTSITVLMLTLGLYFQLQLLQKNKPINRLRKKFEKQYSVVMSGKKLPAEANPTRKLTSELRRIRDVKKGKLSITGGKTVSAKLIMVLEAFNKCAAETNLAIDSISITDKAINIAGDTSSRKNTLKLFESIKESKLQILKQGLDSKGKRDIFNIIVMPKE